MSVEIVEIEVEEPVEFEITLRLTRNEARDLWTRLYEFPYPSEPTGIVTDLCEAFGNHFNGVAWGFEPNDRLHPEGFKRWNISGVQR